MALSLEISGIVWWNFAHTLILIRCSLWDCQMAFGSGWDFAEVQILKKKWNQLLNRLEYFDKSLQTIWCWKDLAQRKSQNDIYYRSRLCRVPNSEKVKMVLSLELLVYYDKILHIHYYWHDLDRGIAKSSPRDYKMTFNIGRVCTELQSLKKWKWPRGLLWWNFAYTLILTRCSPRDCQMSFGIGRGVAEVQMLKNSETGPISWNALNILIKLWTNIAIDVS